MSPRQSIQITPVRSPEDLAAAIKLVAAYVKSLGIDLTFQDFQTEMSQMPGKYSPPTGELLLARSGDGTPVGCVGLRPLSDPGCCEMKRLYVSPAGRGLGTGQALLDATVSVARKLNFSEMRLDTLPSMVSARAMYKKNGFTDIEPYYETPMAGTCFLSLNLQK